MGPWHFVNNGKRVLQSEDFSVQDTDSSALLLRELHFSPKEDVQVALSCKLSYRQPVLRFSELFAKSYQMANPTLQRIAPAPTPELE